MKTCSKYGLTDDKGPYYKKEDKTHYCQNSFCKNRFNKFELKDMIRENRFLFCSKECVKKFKLNNL